MWQVANLAFNVYFTQDPLSLDSKTISEKSPDPNGTLLTGLKSSQAPLTQVCSHVPNIISEEYGLKFCLDVGVLGVESHCPELARQEKGHLRRR
jgi:hypothetical protein